MSLQVKGGSLTQPLSTGNSSVTGVGFRPKAVIIWGTKQTAGGTGAHANFSITFFDSSDGGGLHYRSDDAQGTSVCKRRCYGVATANMGVMADAGGVLAGLRFASMDSDGFTINWVNVDGSAWRWQWLAIGGDIVQAKVGDTTKPTGAAPATHAVTGVGFKPDCILLLCARTNTGSTIANAAASIGFASGVGQEQSVSLSSTDAAATSDTRGILDNAALLIVDETSSTLDGKANLASFDSDGFTLTWNTNDATADPIIYLALKGVQAYAGAASSPNGGTPPVAQSLTGIGFMPKAALFLTRFDATSGSVNADAGLGFGVAVGVSDVRYKSIVDQDNAGTSVAKLDDSTAACLGMLDNTGANVEYAEFSAFSDGQIDLSWGLVDATQRDFAFLALGAGRPTVSPLLNYAFEIPQDDRPGLREFGFEAVGPDEYLEGLKLTYSGEAATLYRIADDDLERREIFKTDAASPTEPADPDPASATAWATYTASPYTTPALTVSKISKLLICTRNKYNLLSMNRTPRRFELDGSGNLVANPPSAPTEVSIAADAGGTFLIEGEYAYLEDGDDAADTFLVYLTTGGGTPNPAVDTPVEVPMVKRDGFAHLSYTSGAVAHGVVGKVIVRTRKQGTPDVDSRNSDVFTATASTAGPSGDAGGAFFGAVAEQHD